MIALTLLVLSQNPVPLPSLFSQRAEVQVEGEAGDWARLPLTEEVLRQVERDLSDLRLVDSSERLVPFVVQRERNSDEEERVTLTQITSVHKELPSAPGTPNTFEESATFSLPSLAQRNRSSKLELTTSTATFVRFATAEALSETGAVVGKVSTTLFRLPQGEEQLEIVIPALEAKATKVKITLTGQGDGFLNPLAHATFPERAPPVTKLAWPLVGKPTQEGKTTVWRVEKPRGFVPVRLQLSTTTPWFNRRVVVQSASSVAGEGRLFRRAGEPRVERLELPLRGMSDESLEVRIEDEDSPMLDDLQLAFVVEQPELVFAVPYTLPVTLYFGGHRTRRAHFDTSGVDERVRLPVDLPASKLGPIVPNKGTQPSLPLQDFRRPGAAVELPRFQHQATVKVDSGTGATQVSFTGDQVASMSTSFHDLRLVDAENRQRPYLLQESSVQQHLTVTRSREGTKTKLEFEVQGQLQRLTVKVPAGTSYFSRSSSLRFQGEGKLSEVIASEWLTYNPAEQGHATTDLELYISRARTGGKYTLELEDGSDAPVEGLELEATLHAPQLLSLLEPGTYRALWGAPGVPNAQYDLERVRDVLEELQVTVVTPEAASLNPAYVEPTLVEQTGGATRWIFWAVLALAVVVLGGVVVRVARAEPENPSGGPPAS